MTNHTYFVGWWCSVGFKGTAENVPPNSWLVYDVEMTSIHWHLYSSSTWCTVLIEDFPLYAQMLRRTNPIGFMINILAQKVLFVRLFLGLSLFVLYLQTCLRNVMLSKGNPRDVLLYSKFCCSKLKFSPEMINILFLASFRLQTSFLAVFNVPQSHMAGHQIWLNWQNFLLACRKCHYFYCYINSHEICITKRALTGSSVWPSTLSRLCYLVVTCQPDFKHCYHVANCQSYGLYTCILRILKSSMPVENVEIVSQRGFSNV